LEDTCEIVKDSLIKSSNKAKKHFDRKCRLRELQSGDKVLVLLPTVEPKLVMQWKGSYHVRERVSPADYRIRVGNQEKIYHINMMLKRYYEAYGDKEESDTSTTEAENLNMDVSASETIAAAVLEQGNPDENPLMIPVCSVGASETSRDVTLSDNLTPEQRRELMDLLEEDQDIFSYVPDLTMLTEHQIQLVDDNPVRVKPYLCH